MNFTLAAPLEIKSLGNADAGEFSGYGAIFHSTDRVGDRIMPGAFTESLAERKAMGRSLPMHLNHGLPELGGVRGIGVWKVVEQDSKGLAVEGKISGMNTDQGRLLYERVRDGAIGGLSIGFRVRGNGATYGRSAGEPKRTITAAILNEVSVVDDPAHPGARADNFKSAIAAGEIPTERDFERFLRDEGGFSRAQAETIARLGFKSLAARESGEGEAMNDEAKAALAELRATARGFSLSSF